MTADLLYDAIGEIRDDLILDAETAQSRPRRSVLRVLAAACAAVLLLAVPVNAEVRTGYVSNLLAPLYGGAQTELVDSIGVPIGASSTVGGYTLSAEAVIGDRYNLAIVYSLTRDDGGRLPDGLRFRNYIGAMSGTGRSGGRVFSHKMSEDGTRLEIVETWTSHSRLFWLDRRIQVSFCDLEIYDRESETATILQKGTWNLEFIVRYEDTTRNLPDVKCKVTGDEGNVYEIHKIQLSPFGIHIDLTAPNFHRDGDIYSKMAPDFKVSLLLTDGTKVDIEDHNYGSYGNMEAETHKADWTAMLDTPIPVEQIHALIVCGREIPVD